MRRLGIHKNIPVSATKLTLGIRVGFISSHLTVVKLFPVNPRAITGPPKMSFLLEAKSHNKSRQFNGYHLQKWKLKLDCS